MHKKATISLPSITEGTGSHNQERYNIIDYPFGKYTVKVVINEKNEFVGVKEIQINKDFLTFEQKNNTIHVLDVDDYYRE